MRLIDADELAKVKFHALPYTHITPSDLMGMQTEAYERGWNDAIDAIIENAETVEPQQKKGKWVLDNRYRYETRFICSECNESEIVPTIGFEKYKTIWDYCPNCGSYNGGDDDETD